MSAKEKPSSIFAALGKSAGAAFSRLPFAARFSAKSSEPTPIRLFTPLDPTVTLFPDDQPRDEEFASLPLGQMLDQSAKDIVARAYDLKQNANKLVLRIADRCSGELTIRTQFVRLMIAITWIAVGGWLYNGALTAQAANETALQNGMPVTHALTLSETFLLLGAAGAGVAFLISALTNLMGRGNNKKVREEAEQLGLAIADAARDFDEALSRLRSSMDRRPRPADSVSDLSRAHLTALEACAYFRDIAFLTHAEGDQARRLFRGFLRRDPVNPPPIYPFLSGSIMTAIVYRYIDWRFFTEHPPSAAPPLPITEYPWALMLLFLGGLLYASAGVILDLFRGAVTQDVASSATDEALDALRSGFTSREAPRPSDIILRINDAVEVFRARVGGTGAKSNHMGTEFAADAPEPEWRRRDSSVKFVDAGFSPAPESWRTDAFSKKFEAQNLRGSGAKRGGEAFKNKPRD